MAINLSRNTRMWITTETVDANRNGTNTYEIGIQDGYSFGSQLNSTDITLNEAGAKPNRGSARFNDSTSPVDWSFSTYIRPIETVTNTNRTYLADAILWSALASPEAHDPEWDDGTKAIHGVGNNGGGVGDSFEIGFLSNGVHELAKIQVIFKVDNMYTTINDVQVGQAEISVDIDGIGSIAWSGQGTSFSTTTIAPLFSSSGAGAEWDSTNAELQAVGYVVVPLAAKYLKNKLSTVEFSSSNADGNDTSRTYSTLGLTGATVTINNNITYLTPETLGTVDTPIGSFTGSFDVSGSMTCYLDTSGTTGSYQLLSDLQANKEVKNKFSFVLNLGGPTAERLVINMPMCHLSVPELSIDDVVGVSIDFKGLPDSLDTADAGTEISLTAFAS